MAERQRIHWEERAMGDDDVQVALRRHWTASDANDFATEHHISRADAVLEYPQSGERIRGRANIEASRVAQPSTKRFTGLSTQNLVVDAICAGRRVKDAFATCF
jgi:hypothetical protein